jgi:hypothetical protein
MLVAKSRQAGPTRRHLVWTARITQRRPMLARRRVQQYPANDTVLS